MNWWQWLLQFLGALPPPPPAAPARELEPPPPRGRLHVWEYFEPNPSRRPLQHPYCVYCGETKSERNAGDICPKLKP